ncbi:histone H3.v1-like protein isoform X2 [Cinnamomum micranthum f. kanehirae]|uniref:Histone H3.v1-like protein isoform X2 n=1 Tax=Cinnamomum micranthum f. kanehirae TaxID=337451 RepID=A0A443NG40_9MAGN|nr:histone H3.v1-like protein isoform X2 [Cinnamomum micranthum f. kanehirae]
MAREGEEADYESDPEEAMLPLTMRRREASDDEEGDVERREKKPAARVGTGSDVESDGQGGAEAYDDEESEIDEEVEEEEEDGDDGSEEVEFEERRGGGRVDVGEGEVAAVAAADSGVEGRRSVGESGAGSHGSDQGGEEEKKENEPFAVPTAGAFYMHDDRFQENGSGRHRRTSTGRKLWESKDNRAWVHDRFEEMNLQDNRYDKERRNGKGHFRGRGRYRGTDRYVRGNGSRAFDDGNNQNRNYKGVRGRGPRRYEPPAKNKEMPAIQDKRSGKSIDRVLNANLGREREPSHSSNAQPDLILPRKHVFASSLNSASPPFYPSGSSKQDMPISQKRDPLTGSPNRNLQSSLLSEEKSSTSHSTSLMRGKTIAQLNAPERSFMDDSVHPISGKQLNNFQSQSSGSSMPLNTRQTTAQLRSQERGPAIGGQLNYQQSASHFLDLFNRGSAQTQIAVVQQRSIQSPVQPASRVSPQQLGQRPGSGTQGSLNQASSADSSEAGDMESPPASSKSNTALAGKAKDSTHGSGKSSILYGGSQVIGATGPMGLAHGDQKFSATPALLPVMQFGGQHHGGLGVPAVGMALPGYVAQPQLGFGNSEMTWVPVLAGAAGALGSSYCSPYIAVDGGYYARSSGQASSASGLKETGTSKSINQMKSRQTPELVSDEFGQRQNKPRRYSEMNFGQ